MVWSSLREPNESLNWTNIMTSYQLRFIRPDDTFKKSLELEFGSEKEARDFVVESYPQRATELWSNGRRVSRRTSPRHEERLRGFFPRVSRFPVLHDSEFRKLEQRHGLIAYSDFELIGSTAMQVYRELGKRLLRHGVWYRAFYYPLPPPSAAQHAYFSFGISEQYANEWVGFANCGIYSHSRDGPAILDDLITAAAAGLIEAFGAAGIAIPEHSNYALTYPPDGHVVNDGPFLTGGATRRWHLKRPPRDASDLNL